MSTAQDLADLLLKGIGDNANADAVKQFLDTGYPPLNKIISGSYSGGLPYGRLMEMFGESSTGKTALATKWMVKAQQLGGVAGFIDWERSFHIELAKHFGLRDDRPYWIYKKPKTWEEGNMVAAKSCQIIRASKVIPDDAPILFVLDSIAAAVPKSVIDKELDELSMNDTTALARVTSTTLKNMAQFAEEYNAIFLYLNQVRLKPNVMYGSPLTTPGGKAMEFYASARLALGRQKMMDSVDGEKQFVGQSISIQCTKSKFTKPFQEAELRMMFDDTGAANFDMVASLIEFLIKKGLIEYSKPRVTWEGTKYFVKQLVEKLSNEPDGFDKLVALLPKGEAEETA